MPEPISITVLAQIFFDKLDISMVDIKQNYSINRTIEVVYLDSGKVLSRNSHKILHAQHYFDLVLKLFYGLKTYCNVREL